MPQEWNNDGKYGPERYIEAHVVREMEKYYKIEWLALLLAMAGDIIVSWVLPLFYKNYSCAKMSISALGNPQSPVRVPFNIWMFLEGVLFR